MIKRLVRITCRQANHLLSQRMDTPLPWPERVRLTIHLAICDACSRVDRQFETLRQATRRLGE